MRRLRLSRGGLPGGCLMPGYSRRRTRLAGVIVSCLVVTLVFGCAVGPDFRRPTPPEVTSYARPSLAPTTASATVAGGEAQRFIYARDLSDQWGTLFECPPLTRLIEGALNGSRTLISAKAALQQARALVLAQRGRHCPAVQG